MRRERERETEEKNIGNTDSCNWLWFPWAICLSSASAPTSPWRLQIVICWIQELFYTKETVASSTTSQQNYVISSHHYDNLLVSPMLETSLRLFSTTREWWQLTSPFPKNPAQKFRLPVASVFGQQFKAKYVTKVPFSQLEKSFWKSQALYKIETNANYLLSLQTYKQKDNNFKTTAAPMVPSRSSAMRRRIEFIFH